jgi:hypothetical protein
LLRSTKVRYIKYNALAGRSKELTSWEDYTRLAHVWRDEVANVRLHRTTRERPGRFEGERRQLRAWPALVYNTDEVLTTIVSSRAGSPRRESVFGTPPVGKTITVRANTHTVRLIFQGQEIACHTRCYDRRQIVCQVEHQWKALQLRHRMRASPSYGVMSIG